MTRAVLVLPAVACCLAFGQPSGQSSGMKPRFIAADVHSASPDELNWRPVPIHDDRYEVKGATMLDLIASAWGWDSWKIVGGPNWLELDHFDITAKLPAGLSLDKRMLQALLEDRFHLVVREETRPLPGYVLTLGKRPVLKKATAGKSGCVPYVSATPTRMDLTNENGPNPVRYTIGPGSTVTYNCHNITMDDFAQGLQAMIGANLAPGPIANGTGLKGAWDFDLHWTHQYVHLDRLPQGHTTISDALDQQLGLKLEERPVPAPALVVVSVNRTPAANSQDVAKVLPPIPEPKQFDVASVRPADPQHSRTNMRIEPARLTLERYPMRYLFNVAFPGQRFENLPDWAEIEAFNITATGPPGVVAFNRMNLAAPMQALLRDRFKLKYHIEQRPGPAYRMDAVKPKMKKADPSRRASCLRDTAPSGAQGFLTRFRCQNITMTEFAEWFSHRATGLRSGAISDNTALSGRWDFALVYDPGDHFGTPSPGQTGEASDPSGGYTIFEAFERQLGLKLVTTTSPQPVMVIDHLERKPTGQ